MKQKTNPLYENPILKISPFKISPFIKYPPNRKEHKNMKHINDTVEYLRRLHYALLATKGRNYNKNDYTWRLGEEVLKELVRSRVYTLDDLNESLFCFGIKVEVDYDYSCNIQLFEDITNKIYLPSDKTHSDGFTKSVRECLSDIKNENALPQEQIDALAYADSAIKTLLDMEIIK